MPFLSIEKKKYLGLALKWSMNTLSYIAPPIAGRLAMEVFMSPQKGRYKEGKAMPAEMLEAKTETIRASGLHIRIWRWPGEGKRIMLAHGWESNSARWAVWIGHLKKEGYDITAVDAPAHGSSEGSRFSAVLYAKVLQEAISVYKPEVLIGHSAGGIAGVYVHSHLSEARIKNLILLAVPSELEALTRIYQQLLGFNDRVMTALDKQFQLRYGAGLHTFSVKQFVKKVSVPGLIVHDKSDKIAPFQDMLEAHHNWAGSRIFMTEGLGHSLASERVIQEVKKEISSCC